MTFRPYVRRPARITDAEQAAPSAAAEQLRRDQQVLRAETEAARRTVLAAGPALVDLAAALTCRCSCHPQPARRDLHAGGADCPCQKTPHELAEARRQFLARSADLREELTDQQAALGTDVAAAADRLGAEIDHIGGIAPFVITGTVDGRAFCLRERHDQWQVEIGADETPLENPWTSAVSIVVASGSTDTLPGGAHAVHALETAVGAVRLFLQRRACPHPDARRFCPDCGADTDRADDWRIHTRL